MMKQTLLKITILALYVTSIWVVLATPELFSGVIKLFALFGLAYCGIIVLAHLVSSFWTICCWCVAAREQRKQAFIVRPVEFEAETEAT